MTEEKSDSTIIKRWKGIAIWTFGLIAGIIVTLYFFPVPNTVTLDVTRGGRIDDIYFKINLPSSHPDWISIYDEKGYPSQQKEVWIVTGVNPKMITTNKSVYKVTWLSNTQLNIVDTDKWRNIRLNLRFEKLNITSR